MLLKIWCTPHRKSYILFFFVYSLCGIYGSWVYQIWERSSWMSWWIVCCHTWAHRKRHLLLVVRWPGGPRISPHIPFSTISMVRKMYLNISLSHIRLISVATKWLSHRPTNWLATLLQFQVAREKCAFPWWNRLHQKPSSRLVPSLLVHLPGKLWATVQPVSDRSSEKNLFRAAPYTSLQPISRPSISSNHLPAKHGMHFFSLA